MKPEPGKIRHVFKVLFHRYIKDLEQSNQDSIIFREYLEGMSQEYKNNTRPAEIVRDFIAGMTDKYFLRQCPQNIRPEWITGRLLNEA